MTMGWQTIRRSLLPTMYNAGAIGTDAGKVGLVLGALINEDRQLMPQSSGRAR